MADACNPCTWEGWGRRTLSWRLARPCLKNKQPRDSHWFLYLLPHWLRMEEEKEIFTSLHLPLSNLSILNCIPFLRVHFSHVGLFLIEELCPWLNLARKYKQVKELEDQLCLKGRDEGVALEPCLEASALSLKVFCKPFPKYQWPCLTQHNS